MISHIIISIFFIFSLPSFGDEALMNSIGSFFSQVNDSTAGSAPGSTYCENCNYGDAALCDIQGVTTTWKKNCKYLLSSSRARKRLPKGALQYALKSLKVNESRFKSTKCYEYGDLTHYSMSKVPESNFKNIHMKHGISNKCTMIISDVDQRIDIVIKENGKNVKTLCRMRMFYVDLCSKNSSTIIRESVSGVGHGTCRGGNGFKNIDGKKTTLLGSFVTGKLFNFKQSNASHNKLRKEMGGFIPAVSLFGLNNSNSKAAKQFKYLHVDSFMSEGCVVVDKRDAAKVIALAKRGPSLVVNYKAGMMEDITKCSKK